MDKVIYFHNVRSSFMTKDVQSLKRNFNVVTFDFKASPKWMIPLRFVQQLVFIIRHLPDTKVQVSLLGGYHSFLPALFGKVFGKKSIIVLGGSDCVSFPSINYGNFNKGLQGLLTRWSIQLSDHLAPVDASLVSTEYNYTDTDPKNQGYVHYCNDDLPPFTVIHFGYDSEMFKRTIPIIEGSFLTVGYLNPANYYRKGIDLIFDQAKRRPKNTFTIIGGTKDDLPKEIEIPSNVTLLASVSYQDLVSYYASHQFYFQLSMMEGFPSAICESMLCECIPIGSDVAAIPNIIGDSGYVLKRKNFNLLDELVERALNEANAEKANRAREIIMENYPKNERDKIISLVHSQILN